jgi:hypothetical protein
MDAIQDNVTGRKDLSVYRANHRRTERTDEDARDRPVQSTVAKNNKFGLEDRFLYGNLEIKEVCDLKNCSRSKFYQDRKAGLVDIQKVGSKSVVPGPIAKKYISGEPIA